MGRRDEDIYKENLAIAQMLKKDCEQIKEPGINEKVIEQIRDYKTPKRKNYKIVCAVAACILLCVTLFVWRNMEMHKMDYALVDRTEKETEALLKNDKNIRLAKSYQEIESKISKMSGEKTAIPKGSVEKVNGTDENVSGVNTTDEPAEVEYSYTNQQTENVDEADIVKTDGKYIYTLSPQIDSTEKNNEQYDVSMIGAKYILTITKVDGKKMKKVSSITIDDELFVNSDMEMYILGDNLVLVGDFIEEQGQSQFVTCIYTFDIRNRKKIKLKDKNIQDGSYHSSRLVNGYLYTVSTYDVWDNDTKECVPKINKKKMGYQHIYVPAKVKNESPEYTIITALNINDSNDFASDISILGGVTDIYVSQNNIYLLNVYYDTKDITNTEKGKEILKDNKKKEKYKVEKTSDYTEIIKYSYQDGSVNYVASTNVLGRIDDQFSLDEKDGYLRLVVHENNTVAGNLYRTLYDVESKEKTTYLADSLNNDEREECNDVYVLGQNLDIVASIKGLAKNEEIYAARFLGDYGYFVSFENTDPLFTIDFSDIKNPKVAGKLKMPGFSDYLQFYSNDLLFGIGENGDEKGNIYGLKIDMYDVKKGEATLKTKHILEDYDYSEALYNYKAILIDSEKELIGFYAEKNSKSYETNYLLYTYKNNKFQKKLEIPLGENVEDIRGLYIGNYYYIVNPSRKIIAVNLDTYKKEATVKIG